MSKDTKLTLWSVFAGFIICGMLGTMPFADGEKYRRAIRDCEKTLPRNQNCKVIGVPDEVR